MRINVCPGDDVQTSSPSEAGGSVERVARSRLIQTNLTEARGRTFHELNSPSLVWFVSWKVRRLA